MFDFLFKKVNKREDSAIEDITKEKLEQSREVLESLRDYDQGKKEISTTNVEEHLRNLQHST